MKHNKRDQAILDWVERHRPDALTNVREIIDECYRDPNSRLNAVYLVMLFAFEGGRQFQLDNPTLTQPQPHDY